MTTKLIKKAKSIIDTKRQKKTSNRVAKIFVPPTVYTAGSPWRLSKEREDLIVVYDRSTPTVGSVAYTVQPSTGELRKDKDMVRSQFAKANGIKVSDTNSCSIGHYKNRFDKRSR